MTAPTTSPPPIDPWRWGVVWLMFLATMINYMDRQTMQVTSTHIIREFTPQFAEWGFGPEKGYGVIESAFNYAFAIAQILAGLLADRLSLRWVYAGALLLWSAAGLLTGMVDTLAMMLMCRIVLGVGEAFNWPCAIHVVKRVVPHESRSLANGIFHSGASIGAAAVPLLAVALVGANGERWRWLFIGVGGFGAIWALLWFTLTRGSRAAAIERAADDKHLADFHKPKPPFWRIFTLERFWLALAFGTSVNVCWHFFRVWLPRILRRDLSFGEYEMLWVLAGFFVAADLGSMLAGWTTRQLTRGGLSVERSRKLVMLGTSSLCLLAAPAVQTSVPWLSVPLIFIVAAGAMGGFANYFALSQDVSAHHTSFVAGILGSVPWFMLAFLNPRIGEWADKTGSFSVAVLIVGFVPLAGASIALLWPEQRRESNQPGLITEAEQAQ
jgi:ACS family hexuronate transporter-like MFS transporter